MRSRINNEVAYFEKAAIACRDYAGAIPRARGTLTWLRHRQAEFPKAFTAKMLAIIEENEMLLPEPVDLITCPTCEGTGRARVCRKFKPACSRCGGWKKVEKTEDAVREREWIWGNAA